jgi:hypothetical protein
MVKARKVAKASRKQYARLQPRVKTLNETTIRKRWRKLPIRTQARVAELLREIERPSLTHNGNDKKNVEVQAAVGNLVEEYDYLQLLSLTSSPVANHRSQIDPEASSYAISTRYG